MAVPWLVAARVSHSVLLVLVDSSSLGHATLHGQRHERLSCPRLNGQ